MTLRFAEGPVTKLRREFKLVLVGDASMAPYELLGAPGYGEEGRVPGVAWLMALREHFAARAPEKV